MYLVMVETDIISNVSSDHNKNVDIKNLKVLGAIKPKGLHRIAKIGYSHLCLREENLSFINNVCLDLHN